MKIPVIEKFFGCVELRQATIGIGWGYGIVLVINFIGFLLSLIGNKGPVGSNLAAAIFSLVFLGFCVLLVLGAQRERESYVRIGMYFLIAHAILLVITTLISILAVGLFFLFVYLPLTIYCVITVRSYLLQLQGSGTSHGGV